MNIKKRAESVKVFLKWVVMKKADHAKQDSVILFIIKKLMPGSHYPQKMQKEYTMIKFPYGISDFKSMMIENHLFHMEI